MTTSLLLVQNNIAVAMLGGFKLPRWTEQMQQFGHSDIVQPTSDIKHQDFRNIDKETVNISAIYINTKDGTSSSSKNVTTKQHVLISSDANQDAASKTSTGRSAY